MLHPTNKGAILVLSCSIVLGLTIVHYIIFPVMDLLKGVLNVLP